MLCSKIGKKCNFKSTKTHFLPFQKWQKINFCTRKKFKTTKNPVFFSPKIAFLIVLTFFLVQKLIFFFSQFLKIQIMGFLYFWTCTFFLILENCVVHIYSKLSSVYVQILPTKGTKIFVSHKLLSFWNIRRWGSAPISPTQMAPLDMNLKFIFPIGTIIAVGTIEGFFSSMCWNVSFHVSTFSHDFWTKWTSILSWSNNLWFILQQQREKNFYFPEEKKIPTWHLLKKMEHLKKQPMFIQISICKLKWMKVSNMSITKFFPFESTITNATWKWLFASMFSNMILHVLLCSIFFWTKGTSVTSAMSHINWFSL